MLIYKNENIIETDCEAIIHGVNCQGKMASGVAKALREKYPEIYESYIDCLKEYQTPLGFVDICDTFDGRLLGNCFTQEFYGRDGKRYANIQAVRNSINEFCRTAVMFGYYQIASPKIGCGLGGLSWEGEVKAVFEEASERWGVDFVIYDNGAKP